MCRIAPNSLVQPPAAAACLIKHQGQLLALQKDQTDHWWLPQQRLNKALSPQCTAHQAVWKNTGLNVEVGPLLMTGKNQIQYFSCQLTDPYTQQLSTFDVPPWANREVQHIALVDPFALKQQEWNEQINLIEIRQAFTLIDKQTP